MGLDEGGSQEAVRGANVGLHLLTRGALRSASLARPFTGLWQRRAGREEATGDPGGSTATDGPRAQPRELGAPTAIVEELERCVY